MGLQINKFTVCAIIVVFIHILLSSILKCIFLWISLFLTGLVLYGCNYAHHFKISHIKDRFINGALIHVSKGTKIFRNGQKLSNQNIHYYDSIKQHSNENMLFESDNHYKEIKHYSDERHEDQFITNDTNIDEILFQIIDYILRDFILVWYKFIVSSTNQKNCFYSKLKKLFAHSISKISQEFKHANLTYFFAKTCVEIFVNHLKLYKFSHYNNHNNRMQSSLNSSPDFLVQNYNNCHDTKKRESSHTNNSLNYEKHSKFYNTNLYPKNDNFTDELMANSDEQSKNQLFFESESLMEQKPYSHASLSNNPYALHDYFRKFSQLLLYILVPVEEYTRILRHLLSEVLAHYVFCPIINLLSDPDYLNQLIIWLLGNYVVTVEHFLDTIRLLDTIVDLEAIRYTVLYEITIERSKDTGGMNDSEIKQRLQSLNYLKRILDSRIKRMKDGNFGTYNELHQLLKSLSPEQASALRKIDFSYVLDHTISMDYFINYLNEIQCQNYLYFYLSVESFKTLSREQIPNELLVAQQEANARLHFPETNLNMVDGLLSNFKAQLNTKASVDCNNLIAKNIPICVKLVATEAQKIFDQYLMEKAPHYIKLDSIKVGILKTKLKMQIPSPDWFDDLQQEVYKTFTHGDNCLFESFKRHDLFCKMLNEMDLIPDCCESSCTSSSNGTSLECSPPIEKIQSLDQTLVPVCNNSKIESINSVSDTLCDATFFIGESTHIDKDSSSLNQTDIDYNSKNVLTNYIQDYFKPQKNNNNYENTLNSNQIFPTNVNNKNYLTESCKSGLAYEYQLTAHVTHIVVARDMEKTFAMYAITIGRKPLISTPNKINKDIPPIIAAQKFRAKNKSEANGHITTHPKNLFNSTRAINGYIQQKENPILHLPNNGGGRYLDNDFHDFYATQNYNSYKENHDFNVTANADLLFNNNVNVIKPSPFTSVTARIKTHWVVHRRYSEFHDFHMSLRERFSDIDQLKFPPKRPFGNMTKEFLEKRLKSLDSYIKTLVSPEFTKTHKGLKDMVEHFLEPGPYEKWNGNIARKMDTFVNPLKISMRAMGSMVKTVPENIVGSVVRVSDTMKDGIEKFAHLATYIPGVKQLTDPNQGIFWGANAQNYGLIKAHINSHLQGDDNITFKVLILLMDEIFDLRTRNQWLRHRMVVILRQLFQVTYGGFLNRKLLEQIDHLTSSQQIYHYLQKFRDTFWPDGVWYGANRNNSPTLNVERDVNLKARTKVLALAKIISAVPDEIRTLVGSETTKDGLKITFNMLQCRAYNRRFFLVLFESLCGQVFKGGLGHKMIHILAEKCLLNNETYYLSKNGKNGSYSSTKIKDKTNFVENNNGIIDTDQIIVNSNTPIESTLLDSINCEDKSHLHKSKSALGNVLNKNELTHSNSPKIMYANDGFPCKTSLSDTIITLPKTLNIKNNPESMIKFDVKLKSQTLPLSKTTLSPPTFSSVSHKMGKTHENQNTYYLNNDCWNQSKLDQIDNRNYQPSANKIQSHPSSIEFKRVHKRNLSTPLSKTVINLK